MARAAASSCLPSTRSYGFEFAVTEGLRSGGSSGPVINTEKVTIGDTKDFSQITNLPVRYRGAPAIS